MENWAYEYLTPISTGYKMDYLPGSVGLKDVRTGSRQKLHIRCKTRVSLSNGYVEGSKDQNFSRGETRKQRRTREYFAKKANK